MVRPGSGLSHVDGSTLMGADAPFKRSPAVPHGLGHRSTGPQTAPLGLLQVNIDHATS
jgi:hypothetical protein